jgi:hypothetical protein
MRVIKLMWLRSLQGPRLTQPLLLPSTQPRWLESVNKPRAWARFARLERLPRSASFGPPCRLVNVSSHRFGTFTAFDL